MANGMARKPPSPYSALGIYTQLTAKTQRKRKIFKCIPTYDVKEFFNLFRAQNMATPPVPPPPAMPWCLKCYTFYTSARIRMAELQPLHFMLMGTIHSTDGLTKWRMQDWLGTLGTEMTHLTGKQNKLLRVLS